MANVFISHRGSDAQQAERLANEIRNAGHQVWLDEWEIKVGDCIVERINAGLEGATYLVLCYSSSGVMSPWMAREWMSTLARQLSGHGVKILPVLLTGGDPPAILAGLKYADLVSDWSQGISELLQAIDEVNDMKRQVLIAHAEGEEHLAEQLAEPLRNAGYEVAHQGTVMVGESVTEEASKILSTGGPVVLCGTIKAMGTGWAHQFVNAAQQYKQVRVFAVQMEKDAYLQPLSLAGSIALYWQDPTKAVENLVASLQKYYPLDTGADYLPLCHDAERRYRELALKSYDIIDLGNLPVSDRHRATRQLELRRLYVPLRVQVEVVSDAEVDEAAFETIEERRSAMHLQGRADRGEREGKRERVSIGERLAEARCLVVLGEPGAGKTTLVRWIATAYLLRLKQDPDWKDLPDMATLPDEDWLPIVVRCRDLDQSCLDGSLDDILGRTLRKVEMTEAESNALRTFLREKLEQGQALLLLDGLDEIPDPARAGFCRQVEQIHLACPDAPIIATSRIVHYRQMGYRIGRGFEHVTVADFSREDKDDFARRWCAVTELPERQEKATAELIDVIHSTDRIERLTVTPLLLTTLALVRRKVGKLPTRRSDLYWEAVQCCSTGGAAAR